MYKQVYAVTCVVLRTLRLLRQLRFHAQEVQMSCVCGPNSLAYISRLDIFHAQSKIKVNTPTPHTLTMVLLLFTLFLCILFPSAYACGAGGIGGPTSGGMALGLRTTHTETSSHTDVWVNLPHPTIVHHIFNYNHSPAYH